jgi:hypothetical protein
MKPKLRDDIKRDSFSKKQAAEILNIKPTRLQEWLDQEFISASIKQSEGRGSWNFFSLNDLFLISIFEVLISIGRPREFAGGAIKVLTKHYQFNLDNIAKDKYKFLYIGFSPDDPTFNEFIPVKSELTPKILDGNHTCKMFINLISIKSKLLEAI